MNNGLDTLSGLLDAVWSRLETATGPGRFMTLATVGRQGGAEARIVVRRGADRTRGTVEFHTDARSEKMAEIAQNPLGTLVIWDADRQLQARLRVRMEVLSDPERRARWPNVPPASLRGYGSVPAPGRPVDAPESVDISPDLANFAPVEAWIESLDVVVLGEDLHRRALYVRADGFQGGWRAP